MSLFQKLMFNLWYFKKPPWDTNQIPPELSNISQTLSPGRALDLGCGTGTNSIWLAKNGWQVVGLDFAGKAIKKAHKKAAAAKVDVEFIKFDVTNLTKLNSQFDFILDIGCYHNLNAVEMDAYRRNLIRLMSNSGTFLLYTIIKTRGSKSEIGVVMADIEAFTPPLDLVSRQDGWNEGYRASAWLNYFKA